MKTFLALQFTGKDGNLWTHRRGGFWTRWLCRLLYCLYRKFPKLTPKNSSHDPPYVPGTCMLREI